MEGVAPSGEPMALSRFSQQIALRIIDHILLNKLECDSHLREQDLADLFRVSRWPVRSALKFLEELRVVRSERNRGFFLDKGWTELKGTSLNVAMPEEEDESYFAIAEAKLSGELPEQFSENELMRRYRLSRGRALKILNRMAQEGWVERLPGHGWAFLSVLTSSEAYDLGYRFRVTLEPNAVMQETFGCAEASSRAAWRRSAPNASGSSPPLRPQHEPAIESRHDKTIEKAFSKLKALLRKAAERTVSGLHQAILRILAAFTASECANYFASAGYDLI